MTMFLAPYTTIADIDGSPLDAGFLYLGEYGKDPVSFPVEVFWDASFTVPAAQPIRTRNGYPVRNGSPAKVYLKTAQHSVAIKNRKGSFVLVDFYNKGWDASFVVDESGENQQEINNGLRRYVTNISELKSQNPKDLLHITIKDKNSTYKWDSNSTLTPDDYFVIQSNVAGSGRWLLVGDRTVYADELIDLTDTSSQDVLNALNFNNRNLQFNYNYTISDTLRLASDNSSFIGGTTNTIAYNGGSGSAGSLKTIVAIRKANDGAIARQQIKNLSINMGQKDYCIGFDSYYLTAESLVERVSVNNIADNSVGFKISKCWYAKYRQCFVSGYNANIAGRHGTGVLIESLQTDGAQVNAVSVDFRCHTLDIGIHIKPVSYIYGLNMLDMPTIENCNIGIKYDPQSSLDYQVRQSVISAYFENNTKDIVWGDPDIVGSRASKHTWLSCSFDDVHSTIELYEGHHIFIGCKGIKNLHVGAGAKVRLINCGRPTTITGTTSNIVIEQDPLEFVTAGSYKSIYTRPQGALKLKSTIASGDTTATYDLSQALQSTIVSEGQTGMLRIMSRRSYDTAPSILTAVILRKSSGATVTPTNTPPSSLSATLDAAGILTVTDTRSDSRFIDVVFNPD